MVAAIWANSVYDENEEADRTAAIEEIDGKYDEVIWFIKTNQKPDEQEEVDFDTNPFFKPARASMDRHVPSGEEEFVTAAEHVEAERDALRLKSQLDQAE